MQRSVRLLLLLLPLLLLLLLLPPLPGVRGEKMEAGFFSLNRFLRPPRASSPFPAHATTLSK